MTDTRVLVVDDEESMRHLLGVILRKEGYEVDTAASGEEALAKLDTESYGFILSDIRMPKLDGLGVLKEIRRRGCEATVIMMSAFGTIDVAIDAMKNGAYDYVSKPFKADEIVLTLRKAEERERLKRENALLRSAVQKEFGFENIVSKNEVMKGIFDTIRKIAPYRSTVLIQGESGTGKELIARAIHVQSPRVQASFVAINCGAIHENLLESELFGHVKGAFTDAYRTKRGLFEEAHGGTLFLDEIGELPLGLQVKLLRVLQEEEIRRVGDTRTITVDVRIIAATVKDLAKEVKEGRFREDLFYRLNVLPIVLPPLRERREDVPILIEHFIRTFNARIGKSVKGVTKDAMRLLLDYEWKGNVRELENTVERMMVLADTDLIEKEHLPRAIQEAAGFAQLHLDQAELSIKKANRVMEEKLIRRALERTRGNKTHAARLLEISHRSLLTKVKEFGIQ